MNTPVLQLHIQVQIGLISKEKYPEEIRAS